MIVLRIDDGLLIGRIGRERVMKLVCGDVETPGDITGIVYTKMDEDGAWKYELVKNMKAAGIDVSADSL